jgi:hypothetical protein
MQLRQHLRQLLQACRGHHQLQPLLLSQQALGQGNGRVQRLASRTWQHHLCGWELLPHNQLLQQGDLGEGWEETESKVCQEW